MGFYQRNRSAAVTGLTNLGTDHVVVLGDAIDKIAWHKAGTFIADCPALPVEEVPLASKVLEQRAAKIGISLHTVRIHPTMSQLKIMPDANFQRQNASFAVALVNVLLGRLGYDMLSLGEGIPPAIRTGLKNTKWRGRCKIELNSRKIWYFYAAGTEDSPKVGGRWFVKKLGGGKQSQHGVARPDSSPGIFEDWQTKAGRHLDFSHSNQKSCLEAASLLEGLYQNS